MSKESKIYFIDLSPTVIVFFPNGVVLSNKPYPPVKDLHIIYQNGIMTPMRNIQLLTPVTPYPGSKDEDKEDKDKV